MTRWLNYMQESICGEMETAKTDELFHKLVRKAKEKMTYQS